MKEVLKGIKLAIFDHSGVLSDDRIPVWKSNNLLLERYEKDTLSFDDWLDETKATARELLQSRGVEVDSDVLDRQYEEVYSRFVANGDAPQMYSDAPDTLNRLSSEYGMKLIVVSSHPEQNLVSELKGYGIHRFFDKISGNPSPKDVRLSAICEEFDVSPHDAFFVEDTIYGIRHGHNAGVNSFGKTGGYHSHDMLKAENPHAVIGSLDELFDYLE